MSTQETVFKVLSARVSADGIVQVHRAVLAAETGSSARTIDRALKALREAGELETVTGGRFGAPTVYRLVGHSVPTSVPERAIHSAPQKSPQVAQRVTPLKKQRAMCTARCGYPLDKLLMEQGDDMHPWCELGVTSSHATQRQLRSAICQYETTEGITRTDDQRKAA
ncbi:hypothetical protein [Streptomyces ortus]|uniref:Uncharacterized protein n=1 Tax=Streptomyces ortus TaxID=2867268 RepID=A0ABT3UZR4_9ACTN|nr:hypothetical protein [Streptomyces ortus]MCX4232821.1 hypothetical protein [Streptomyces ortus]